MRKRKRWKEITRYLKGAKSGKEEEELGRIEKSTNISNACKHETECDCECKYHLAYRCLAVMEKDRGDLCLFMQSNIEAFSIEEIEEDLVVLCSLKFEPNSQNECSSTRHAGSRPQKQENLREFPPVR